MSKKKTPIHLKKDWRDIEAEDILCSLDPRYWTEDPAPFDARKKNYEIVADAIERAYGRGISDNF